MNENTKRFLIAGVIGAVVLAVYFFFRKGPIVFANDAATGLPTLQQPSLTYNFGPTESDEPTPLYQMSNYPTPGAMLGGLNPALNAPGASSGCGCQDKCVQDAAFNYPFNPAVQTLSSPMRQIIAPQQVRQAAATQANIKHFVLSIGGSAAPATSNGPAPFSQSAGWQ